MKRLTFIALVSLSLFVLACSSPQKPQQPVQNNEEQKTQNEMKQGMNNTQTEMVRDTTPSKNQ
jgi:PBP1b-binding outer membrane lipoprotein LpoB